MASSTVAIYQIPNHKRSTMIAQAMYNGALKFENKVVLLDSSEFREPTAEVAVFYGFTTQMRSIFHAYRTAKRTVVYVDLGYFGRLEGGKWVGYHKVSINSRHPTDYFQKKAHDDRRARKFNLHFPDWADRGGHVLICGTSDKGSLVDGFKPQEWETKTINLLKKVTDRKLIYRPKPSWTGAHPIPGSEFHQSKEPIQHWLKNCHAVVSHHSNACVDAFLAGIPNFCVEGVGAPLSETDFSKIETPVRPDGRIQWGYDLAFCQFSLAEMKDGTCWRVLKEEGHIPQ